MQKWAGPTQKWAWSQFHARFTHNYILSPPNFPHLWVSIALCKWVVYLYQAEAPVFLWSPFAESLLNHDSMCMRALHVFDLTHPYASVWSTLDQCCDASKILGHAILLILQWMHALRILCLRCDYSTTLISIAQLSTSLHFQMKVTFGTCLLLLALRPPHSLLATPSLHLLIVIHPHQAIPALDHLLFIPSTTSTTLPTHHTHTLTHTQQHNTWSFTLMAW